MARKPGRPSLREGERTSPLQTRVPNSECDHVHRLVSRLGLRSTSAFLRDALREKVGRLGRQVVSGPDPAYEVALFTAALKRKQLARIPHVAALKRKQLARIVPHAGDR